MMELIIKMIFWLVTAMVLGFVVAWFLSKTIYNKLYLQEKESLEKTLLERNNSLAKAEKELQSEKTISKKLLENLKNTQKELVSNVTVLKKLEHQLESDTQNGSNFQKREKELKEFEEILLLAEKRIEENEADYKVALKKLTDEIERLKSKQKSDKALMKSYQERIDELKEDLVLYKADTSRPEFIITKDQFVKIEEQLGLYASEATTYKDENSKLIKKLKNRVQPLKSNLETSNFEKLEPKKVNELSIASDDGSVVKAFRQTYKKITNS